jgi:hypothetical protein
MDVAVDGDPLGSTGRIELDLDLVVDAVDFHPKALCAAHEARA